MKIDILSIQEKTGSSYPAPFDEPCKARGERALGRAGGLTQFGVNIMRLSPGAWSSQRHWHAIEDEFVYVLYGDATMVTDEGETAMRPGDAAAFRAGSRNGHHFKNLSDTDVVLLVVGSRHGDDWGEYSDIDMKFTRTPRSVTRRDGSPLA